MMKPNSFNFCKSSQKKMAVYFLNSNLSSELERNSVIDLGNVIDRKYNEEPDSPSIIIK